MISKDKKQITIALPKEMIETMEKAIESSKGHNITKSDIIMTALSLFFKAVEKKLTQTYQEQPKEEN